MFITTALRAMLLAICVLCSTTIVHATVTNSVSVTSSSGGNTIVTGNNNTASKQSSSASVTIQSVINGETVLDIHEESSGEPIVIERTETVDTNGVRASIKVNSTASSSADSVSTVRSEHKALSDSTSTSHTSVTPSAAVWHTAIATTTVASSTTLTNLTRMVDTLMHVAEGRNIDDDSPAARALGSLMYTIRHVFTTFFF